MSHDPVAALFDTHLHPPQDGDFVAYAQSARQAGVPFLLAVGADPGEWQKARDLALTTPGAWFSVGIHPHVAEADGAMAATVAQFATDAKLVAVGEIGLDYYYDNSPPMRQRQVLTEMLALAVQLRRPVILHCRDRDGCDDAYRDLWAAMQDLLQAGIGAVLHCYTGSMAWAERFVAAGAYLGVTGIVTFPAGDNVREIARWVPPERLLLETDSPYLAPVPYRGRPNHSCLLPAIAQRVAAERGMPVAELARMTTANACRLFGVKVSGDAGHE